MADESDVVQAHFGPPAEQPAEPEWTGPSREEWEATQQNIANLAGEYEDVYDDDYDEFDPADPEQLEEYVDERLDQTLGRYSDSEWAEYEARQQAADEVAAADAEDHALDVIGEMARKAGAGNIDPAVILRAGDAYIEHVETVMRAEGYDEAAIDRLRSREFGEAVVLHLLETARVRDLTDRMLKRV